MKARKVVPITLVSNTLNDALNNYKDEVLAALNETQSIDGRKGREKAKTQYKAHAIQPYDVMKKYEKSGKERVAFVKQFYTSKLGFLKQKVSNRDYRLVHLLNAGHISANQYGKNYTVKHSDKGYGGLPRKKTIRLAYWDETVKFLETEYPKDMLETLKRHNELNL